MFWRLSSWGRALQVKDIFIRQFIFVKKDVYWSSNSFNEQTAAVLYAWCFGTLWTPRYILRLWDSKSPRQWRALGTDWYDTTLPSGGCTQPSSYTLKTGFWELKSKLQRALSDRHIDTCLILFRRAIPLAVFLILLICFFAGILSSSLSYFVVTWCLWQVTWFHLLSLISSDFPLKCVVHRLFLAHPRTVDSESSLL